MPNWGSSEDVERDFFGKTEFGRIPDVHKCIEIETSGKNFGIGLLIRTGKTSQIEVRWERAIINLRVKELCRIVNTVY